MTNPIFQKELELFQEEYKKAYKDILSPEVLEVGNSWFESFLLESLKRASLAVVEASVGEYRKPTGSKAVGINTAIHRALATAKTITSPNTGTLQG